jgi:hypothetical protein
MRDDGELYFSDEAEDVPEEDRLRAEEWATEMEDEAIHEQRERLEAKLAEFERLRRSERLFDS